MNTNKLNINQFNEIKNKLASIIKSAEEYYEQHKENPTFNKDELDRKTEEEYYKKQQNLLLFDLSEIPFEAWEGISIFSDKEHPVDFSKTKANIDFSLIEFYSGANFKGCNVRNLQNLGRYLNEKDFDEETINANEDLFLSSLIPSDIKEKYYLSELTIEDISSLSKEQIDELSKKNGVVHFKYEYRNGLLEETLGLNRMVELYNHSKDEYDFANIMLSHSSPIRSSSLDGMFISDFIEQVRTASIPEIKKICNDYARTNLLASRYGSIELDKLPALFVKENSDILLTSESVPQELREKYYNRKLTFDDIVKNIDLFENIPVTNFSDYNYDVKRISEAFGDKNFVKLLKNHPDVLTHIINGGNSYNFVYAIDKDGDYEKNFTNAVKKYFLRYEKPENFTTEVDGRTIYNVPEWLTSMNFHFIENISSLNDLLQYTDNMIITNEKQMEVIDTLGLDNIIKFEQETGFFSHKAYDYSRDLEMFDALTSYFKMNGSSTLSLYGIKFKNGTLNYEEFKNQFAMCLNYMRSTNLFTDYPDYRWIEGKFRDEHPEIFMSKEAPNELIEAYYRNRITPEYIYLHKDEMNFLLDKDLVRTIRADIKLVKNNENGISDYSKANFIDEYVKRFGNEKFLQLCAKYGSILSNIEISNFNDEIENEQIIEKSLRDAIVKNITTNNMDYSYLSNIPEMINEHPELFADFTLLNGISNEERDSLRKAFYTKSMSFDDIKKYPELISILKDKDLKIAFAKKDTRSPNTRSPNRRRRRRLDISTWLNHNTNNNDTYSDFDLLQVYGNEKFLQLCAKYGRYMDRISQYLSKKFKIKDGKCVSVGNEAHEVSFEKMIINIEEFIKRESVLGNISYLPDDAPQFLRQEHPELFLDDNAPEQLKNYFYRVTSNYAMNFMVLQQNKDWLPYLKDKSIATSLLRNPYLKDDLIKFLNVFGEEKAIKLGINRAETVNEMMKAHNVDLMKKWYDKTGGKFIPDFVVMQNFRFEEADKFLASGANWSNLMKIKSFSRTPEARDAMLKLAYSFGAFDQDQRGFKRLQELLTGIPKKIDAEQGYIFEQMEQELRKFSQIGSFFHLGSRSRMDADGNFHRQIFETENSPKTKAEKEIAYNKMIEYIKNQRFTGDLFDQPTVLNFLESIKQENIDIDFTQNIFSQIYRKNDDGSYSLIINQQSCPKTIDAVREMLAKFREIPMMTPNIAHRYLGGFKMEYDDDFREFFLSNYDSIINDSRYLSQISSIQRRFKEIKAVYSNVNLTLDLAMSYIDNNKYENVNVGNERVVKVAALQNYSAQDFETLQKIYNYGKQRTFSSIPRIESKTAVELSSGNYYYEILRLDDPRAMSIGFESDCCQRLGEPAELCMEHSMVDKNGRVFIITNENGEVVAQSWVWRNKDVLCFDNIEVPDQKMWDNGVPRGKEDSGIRNQFTDDILSIYKMVASELIIEDEKVYKELLESGKITQEQYNGLRLGKITTGLGYSNIKGSLKSLDVDKSTVSRPLPFEEPVKLFRGLYTNDSTTQYILEEREDRKEFDGETLPVHSDAYVEYTDNNFTEKSLLSLEKLEIVTKEDPRYLDTLVDEDADKEHLVTEIARNYRLNPETARIVMNPNFAIIYDVNGNELRIGDLLFNTKVDNNEQQMDIESNVVMQIRLALEQIGAGKEINVSLLDDKQKEMYAKATGLTDELDIERGVGHAR